MMKLLIILAANASDFGVPDVTADQGALQRVLNAVFLITGALAVIFMIVGGLQYVISAGDPNQTARAKNTIIYAAIGLIITIFATAIVNFVLNRLA